jgi:hypothetical protein
MARPGPGPQLPHAPYSLALPADSTPGVSIHTYICRCRWRRNISERCSGGVTRKEPTGRPIYKSPPRSSQWHLAFDRSPCCCCRWLARSTPAACCVAVVEAAARCRRRLVRDATTPAAAAASHAGHATDAFVIPYEAPRRARWRCRRWVGNSSTGAATRPGRGSGGRASCTAASCSPWPSSAARTVSSSHLCRPPTNSQPEPEPVQSFL